MSNRTFVIHHCWIGGKTLSNNRELAMSRKRKAAIEIVISGLLEEVLAGKRSMKEKTQDWIK